MSVLYKGLKMPKSCSVCREFYYVPDSVKGTSVRCGIDNKLIHQYSNTVYDIESGFPYKTNRPDWCPLIEVPPHGRLIDGDEVVEIAMEWCPDDDGTVGKIGDLRELLDEIEAMPTIIEAEE